jgi:hypothetical protein
LKNHSINRMQWSGSCKLEKKKLLSYSQFHFSIIQPQ